MIFDETIKKVDLGEEMKKSYIDYSMSVIVARALPVCVTASSQCIAAFFMA